MALRHLIFLCLLTVVLSAKVKLDKKFIKQVVKRHNEIRAAHGLGKVKHKKKISKFAQEWANYLESINTLEHRGKDTQKYGENLSYMYGGSTKGADHVNNLYTKEEQYYRDNNYYNTDPPMENFGKFGHFTQIVWKNCKKIGVGKAGPFVVINYDPPGNYIGQFKDNVPDKV